MSTGIRIMSADGRRAFAKSLLHKVSLAEKSLNNVEQVVYLISSKGFLQYLENRRVEK